MLRGDFLNSRFPLSALRYCAALGPTTASKFEAAYTATEFPPEKQPWGAAERSLTDQSFACGHAETSRLYAQLGVPTYQYQLMHASASENGVVRHGAELKCAPLKTLSFAHRSYPTVSDLIHEVLVVS